jgi:hypothetical protein
MPATSVSRVVFGGRVLVAPASLVAGFPDSGGLIDPRSCSAVARRRPAGSARYSDIII